MKQQQSSCLLDEYLFQQPEPNLSIKLQPVQEQSKHAFTCKCQMCQRYDAKKVIQLLNQKTLYINRKIQNKVQNNKIPSQYFFQVLKKLVLPPHKIVKRGIDLYIPEICFFKDGQCQGMFMNRELEDFTIKRIHKNNVNPGLIQRIFNERRRQYRQDIKKKLGINERRPLTQSKPSAQQKKQKDTQISVGQQKDSVVVKYIDGLESMIPETQFIMMTLRRKQDPIWRTIEVLKNTFAVNDQLNNVFFVKYEKSHIKFLNLLERSRTLIKIYAQNIIPGESKYISTQQENLFSQQLLKKNKKGFAQYVVYKIVSFIEYFHDQEIEKLSCKILINEIEKPYLIDVTSYRKKTLMRFVWTNDTYKKKLDEQQKKMFLERAISVTQELEEKSKLITGMMQQKYSEMKNKYGISLQDSDNQEELKNNQFWKKIHPQFKDTQLSELLMKEKNLTVNGFKRKYLGYKEERKPIVKGFSSHLIKVLHTTTPKLKLSQFHEVSFKPNQSGYLSTRRPNTTSNSKRSSFSLLISSYTKENQASKSPQTPYRSNKPIKRQKSMGSRTPSSSYSKARRPGCHLHAKVEQFSITKDFLNFHK